MTPEQRRRARIAGAHAALEKIHHAFFDGEANRFVVVRLSTFEINQAREALNYLVRLARRRA